MTTREEKKTIAYVNVVGPLGWHRFLYKQCRGLAERNFDVEFYSLVEAEQTIYDVKIIPVKKNKSRIWRFLRTFCLLPTMLRSRYDIITVVNPELLPIALILKFLSRSRIVFDCQESWVEFIQHKGYLGSLGKCLLAWFVKITLLLSSRLLDGFVFSDENISKDFSKLPTGRQTCFHNFPWLGMFPPEPVNWSERQYDLGCAGTLSHTSGLFVMLQAVSLLKKQIPDVKSLFIGEVYPEMKKDIDTFVQKNDLYDNVVFAGQLPHSEVPCLLKQCRIGLVGLLDLPKFHKNIAGKIFDYMACSIPIVSVDLPPERPYITSGVHGFLVPPENPQAMADAAYKILFEPGLGQKMAKDCREHLLKQGYYAEKEIDSLAEFHSYILEHPRRFLCGS